MNHAGTWLLGGRRRTSPRLLRWRGGRRFRDERGKVWTALKLVPPPSEPSTAAEPDSNQHGKREVINDKNRMDG